jgi:hypothetical protein
MVSHMKTTLNIDATVTVQMKRADLPALPTFDGGGVSVDIADRETTAGR